MLSHRRSLAGIEAEFARPLRPSPDGRGASALWRSSAARSRPGDARRVGAGANAQRLACPHRHARRHGVGGRARRPARGAHEPGSYWFYNNWDFNALGTVFERVAGMPLEQALSQWLAQPLGMQTFCPSHVTYQQASFTEHSMYRFYMSATDLGLIGALVA